MFAGKDRSWPVWIQILDLVEKVAKENTGLNAFFINDKITTISWGVSD
jgi:hypothetical protein